MITENNYIPFGPYKGLKLKDCPDKGLQWIVEHLIEGDLCEFALIARDVLKKRKKQEDLESKADEFLREHGVDPKAFQ